MPDWSAFFQVQASASAALLGLVFVGLSINFTKIIDSAHLPNRALEAMVVLFLNLVQASLLLVPGQGLRRLAIELLCLAALVWVGIAALHVQNFRLIEPERRAKALVGTGIGQAATLSWCVGGIVLLTKGEVGLYWLVPSFLLSYMLALLNAWVLMVEINR